jgi:hypothetical protein
VLAQAIDYARRVRSPRKRQCRGGESLQVNYSVDDMRQTENQLGIFD